MVRGKGGGRLAACVLARAPEPGRVKTRLAASLGAAAACELHEAMSLDVLEAIATWARQRGTPDLVRVLAVTGDATAARRLAAPAEARWGYRVEEQVEGDLGARILGVAAARQAEGCCGALVVGTDTPTLSGDLLEEAAAAVSTADLVLAPARDGGVVLLGLGRTRADVFTGVSWGCNTVRAELEARARAVGLRLRVVRGGEDVDDGDSLRRVAAELATTQAAPRVRAWLARHPDLVAS